jgi:hypothetical protein
MIITFSCSAHPILRVVWDIVITLFLLSLNFYISIFSGLMFLFWLEIHYRNKRLLRMFSECKVKCHIFQPYVMIFWQVATMLQSDWACVLMKGRQLFCALCKFSLQQIIPKPCIKIVFILYLKSKIAVAA